MSAKKFIKPNFQLGEYVTYTDSKLDREFIGRFRRGSGGSSKFIKFLIANFTVEEYLGQLENGLAPLEVLKTKGYISPNMTKVLKSYDLPISQDGVKEMHAINRRA